MKEPSQVKTIYCDETIAILNEVKIEELLRACHKLRFEVGLMNKSDIYVVIQSLRMYWRSKQRIMNNRRRKQVKNGME